MEGHRYGPLLPTRHDDDDDFHFCILATMFMVNKDYHNDICEGA